jgi:hypothetical protein
VAVNCWLVPDAIEGLFGFTAIETKAGASTVSVTEFVTEPEVAVIVVGPCARLVASP